MISKEDSRSKAAKSKSPTVASQHSQESEKSPSPKEARVKAPAPAAPPSKVAAVSRKSSRVVVLSQRAAEQSHHSIATSVASQHQKDQNSPDVQPVEDDEDYHEKSVSAKHQSKSKKSLSQPSNAEH